jgi:hypothetical protein
MVPSEINSNDAFDIYSILIINATVYYVRYSRPTFFGYWVDFRCFTVHITQ